MSGFLLDTNVVSELVKPVADANVIGWMQSADESLLYLSVLTLGEIRKGITSLREGARRMRFQSWLDSELIPRFEGRILHVDRQIADRWGRLSGDALLRGKILPVTDALLAATALHHDLTFVTRDIHQLANAGVPCFNPWMPPLDR